MYIKESVYKLVVMFVLEYDVNMLLLEYDVNMLLVIEWKYIKCGYYDLIFEMVFI